MNHRVLVLLGSIALTAGASHAQVVNGVSSSGSEATGYSPQPSVSVQQPEAVHVINFDSVSAPSLFNQTSALGSVGTVKFDGSSTAPKNGGAILNSGSSFGVSGFSAPNFLAFNCNAQLSNGGKPNIPEIVVFPTTVKDVRIRAGSGTGAGKTLKLFGIGPSGVEVKKITLAAALQTISFSKPLQRLLVSSETDACVFVLDDLQWADI